ncbi:hypothetical protein TWF696_008670 [Orbilia brochopaga]|uniref:HNH nuclease domain-containing protein n=1 Tax=Orbilia brochopaga TaxID=3140254 RepID=A0AAV9UJR9_9PEZI
MSSLQFQIPSCRNGYHLVDQSITFASYSGIPDGEDSLISITLSTDSDGPQAKDIRKLAVSWLDIWASKLDPPAANPNAANNTPTPTDSDGVPTPPDRNLEHIVLQNRRIKIYQRYTFLSTLYQECASTDGRNNLAFEILLTVIPPTPTGSECKISTVEELLSHTTYAERSAARAFQRLSHLADYIVVCLIQHFRKYASATPCTPTLDPFKYDSRCPLDEPTQERRYLLQEKVCKRDEFRCAFTGVLSYDTERLFTAAQIEQQKLEFEPVQCMYILPPTNQLPITPPSSSFRILKEKMKFRAMLTFLCPPLRPIIRSQKLDGPINALLLSHSSAFRFANLHVWLTPTYPDINLDDPSDDDDNDEDDNDEDETPATATYKLEALRRSKLPRSLPPNDIITFTARSGVPLPSRHLLQLHRTLAIATSKSGAGEFLDALAEDVENMTVAAVDNRTAECVYYMLMNDSEFF